MELGTMGKTAPQKVEGRRGFQQVVESGKPTLGRGTGVSGATGSGKLRNQMENTRSGGSKEKAEHFRAEDSGERLRRLPTWARIDTGLRILGF